MSAVNYRTLLWPTLHALQELGGSGTLAEIRANAAEVGGFTEDEQAEMMPNGRASRIDYYVAWALTRVKRIGLAENSAQGVWSLTPRGQAATADDADELNLEIGRAFRKLRQDKDSAKVVQVQESGDLEDEITDDQDVDAEATGDWKDDLLGRMKAMDPSAFERLCQRLLREADFDKVQVTGRAGDGGIDGVGLIKLGLLSFPTYFQCKRYQGSVGAGAVRDFRGAMAGRGEKGLLITTATFTPAAQQEATRDGVSPIDLIDGDELCDLLKRHRVGVRVQERVVEDVTVDYAFWESTE